jgi:hypothetical protein
MGSAQAEQIAFPFCINVSTAEATGAGDFSCAMTEGATRAYVTSLVRVSD